MDNAAPLFLIETHVPGLGAWDEALAEDAEQAFCAVETLLTDAGISHTVATVTNLVSDEVVWSGKSVATRAFRGFGR